MFFFIGDIFHGADDAEMARRQRELVRILSREGQRDWDDLMKKLTPADAAEIKEEVAEIQRCFMSIKQKADKWVKE